MISLSYDFETRVLSLLTYLLTYAYPFYIVGSYSGQLRPSAQLQYALHYLLHKLIL